MFNPSKEFVEKTTKETESAAEAYIACLYNFMQTIDLSTPEGVKRSHAVLDMIQHVRTLHNPPVQTKPDTGTHYRR